MDLFNLNLKKYNAWKKDPLTWTNFSLNQRFKIIKKFEARSFDDKTINILSQQSLFTLEDIELVDIYFTNKHDSKNPVIEIDFLSQLRSPAFSKLTSIQKRCAVLFQDTFKNLYYQKLIMMLSHDKIVKLMNETKTEYQNLPDHKTWSTKSSFIDNPISQDDIFKIVLRDSVDAVQASCAIQLLRDSYLLLKDKYDAFCQKMPLNIQLKMQDTLFKLTHNPKHCEKFIAFETYIYRLECVIREFNSPLYIDQIKDVRPHHVTVFSANDAFKVLGIHTLSTSDEIKSAYRVLSKKYHPDLNVTADPSVFLLINKAYQFLRKAGLVEP